MNKDSKQMKIERKEYGVCVGCLMEDMDKSMKSIFQSAAEHNQISLAQIYTSLTNIQIIDECNKKEEDECKRWSRCVRICDKCIDLLCQAYQTQLLFKQSHEQFKQQWKRQQTIIKQVRYYDQYKCKLCNKQLNSSNGLKKHMKCLHSNELVTGTTATTPNSQKRSFPCDWCNKCFPSKFTLKLHYRSHTGERPFICQICSNGYVSKSSLKIHERVHTNERPFGCDMCPRQFKQSGDLQTHRRIHNTNLKLTCHICEKKLISNQKLKYHMRVHTGERPYKCNVCARAFTLNVVLQRHMRTHTGEKPYCCTICGKRFSQISTLNNHKKIHRQIKIECKSTTIVEKMHNNGDKEIMINDDDDGDDDKVMMNNYNNLLLTRMIKNERDDSIQQTIIANTMFE